MQKQLRTNFPFLHNDMVSKVKKMVDRKQAICTVRSVCIWNNRLVLLSATPGIQAEG